MISYNVNFSILFLLFLRNTKRIFIFGWQSKPFTKKFSKKYTRNLYSKHLEKAFKRILFRSNLLLLQHEYAESLLMQQVALDYNTAHKIVNRFYNWEINI